MNQNDMPEGATNPVSKDLLSRIETALLSDLQPVKPVASVIRASFGLLLFGTLVVSVATVRFGLAGWKSSSGLQASVLLGILATSMLLLAHSLSEKMVPAGRRPCPPALLLVLPLLSLALASAVLFPFEFSSKFLSAGLRCWRAGLGCAAAAVPMLWLILRRGYILAPIQYGATAGLYAGLCGVAVLTLECPWLDSLHVTTWHFGAALTTMAIGACAGYIVRTLRRQAA